MIIINIFVMIVFIFYYNLFTLCFLLIFFTFCYNQTDAKMKITFLHPKRSDVLIFIGGDMPHIVKRMVNVLESSSKENSKRNLEYNGGRLN